MGDICGDNRFEVIEKAKNDLLKSTNVDTSPEEMTALDNFLFRCWQMGWLKCYETQPVATNLQPTCNDDDLVSRSWLLAEYDRQHEGPPGGARKIIETAPPAQSEQDWVPVSERMPEEREWVGTKQFGTTISDEVYVTFEAPNGERFVKHLSFQNGKVPSFKQREIDVWFGGATPVAWKPLPEPYQPDAK